MGNAVAVDFQLPNYPITKLQIWFCLFHESSHAHERPMYLAISDQLLLIVCGHAEDMKPSLDPLQHRLRSHLAANPGRRPMRDMDRRAHRDLIALAIRLQGFETRELHPSDRGWRGQYRRQRRHKMRQRVLQLHHLLDLPANSDRRLLGHVLLTDHTSKDFWSLKYTIS